MVFSSAIFLFVFLPIIFVLSILPIPLKYKNGILIISSLLFYAFGEPVYVFLMIISTFVNYILGLILGKAENILLRKSILLASVAFNVLVIIIFKYAGFLVATYNELFSTSYNIPQIALPIGISFFTFQAMSYVIDVYRDNTIVQKNFWKLLLYISFFPQLIAGPIIRYHEIDYQLENREMNTSQIAKGIRRFIKGLFKKLWIANTMGAISDSVFSLDIQFYNNTVAWYGALCYTLQIYYDFSGYSDMAIGLAGMFGFEFKENFDHPYSAMDIKDFWRKWHMSLSGWFKEYVYIPLGGNRRGKIRTEINKFIVFLLTGVWHGANWTFVLWGLFHGIMIILEDTILPIRKLNNKIIRNTYTWLIVIIAFVFFRADTIGGAWKMLCIMFTGFNNNAASSCFISEQLSAYNIFICILAVVFSYPVTSFVGKYLTHRKNIEKYMAMGSVIMLFLCIINLASASYNPFIYFRF